MGVTIGIDLGTTNSVVSMKKLEVLTIQNAEGEMLTPSCVTAIPTADSADAFEYIVGKASRDLLKQYPEQTITSIKRLMGRDFDDTEVQALLKNDSIAYQVTTDPTEPGSIRISLAGQLQSPEMISSIILKKLIRDSEKSLQTSIDQAVVTVPAYFSDRQKFATRAACAKAGIKLLRLLPEPTAAAIAFGVEALGNDESRTLMVFDLGGGTFDVSVLGFSGGSFMEITKGGDMWLGGDNIDQLLVNHVFSMVEQSGHCQSVSQLLNLLTPAEKAHFLVEIKEKTEVAKIALSSESSVNVEMFGLLKDKKGRLIDIDVTITQDEFNELLKPITARVAKIAHQVLHEIHFEPELIDSVLLVGGTSLIPAIQETLKNIFTEEKVLIHPRPMLAIAEGAALMAAQIANKETIDEASKLSMMHSCAHNYYLQLANGEKHLLVERNTPLPVTVEEKLVFAQKHQMLARLRVFSEADDVLDTVGELWFHKDDSELLSFDEYEKPVELMLSFNVDEDNIITMSAWSLKNKEQRVETKIARGGLTSKLYGDLERTLSAIIADCDTSAIEHDALRLSRSVVQTILSATDSVTGETCADQKQKAVQQIKTLKELEERDVPPLSLYRFASLAHQQSEGVLLAEEHSKLTTLLQALQSSIDSLDNADSIEKIQNDLFDFYDEQSIVTDLARAENAAAVLDKGGDRDDARQMRQYAAKLIEAYRKQQRDDSEGDDDEAFDEAREALYEEIHNKISWGSEPSRHFDRDVCL